MDQKKEIRYFAAIHFLMTAMTSFWSYGTIYFRELGFSSSQIGYINASGTFLAMLTLPIIGVISDRIQSPRRLMFILVACIIPATLLMAFGGMLGLPYWVFLVLSTIRVMSRQSANATMDSWAGGEIARLGVSFGSIRRYGSFGYICISLVGAALFGPVLPTWTCLLFSTAICILLLCLIGSHKGDAYEKPVKEKEKQTKTGVLLKLVFRNYYFVTYLFLVMAFDLFLAVVNLDMSYLMDYVGAPRSALGIVGAIRAGTEVVVMIIISKQKKLPPFWMMLVGSGVLIALEHLFYSAATNLLGICLITLFCSGIAGGMFYGIGNNYVFQVVDRHAGSTAMAVLGVAKSLVAVIGSGLGGMVIDQYGVTTLTTGVGILAMILTGIFLVACVLGRFVWKKPYVSEEKTV